jgi:AraC-like DNA-binding protein
MISSNHFIDIDMDIDIAMLKDQKIRLKKATYLLKSGVKSSHVWHQVGFSSHSYFSDLFAIYLFRLYL